MRVVNLFLIPGAALGASILSCTASPVPSFVTAAAREFSGLYTSTLQEDHFVPCGIRGVGDGWALEFRRPRQGIFIGRETARMGSSPNSHFIRVRGTLSKPGRYNFGFTKRQLTVDSVLEVSEVAHPCVSYEDVPEPWSGIPRKGLQIAGATLSDDRTIAAVLDAKGTITIWATDRGQILKSFASQDKGELQMGDQIPLTFSSDRELLATGGADGTVRIWRVSDGKRILSLTRNDSAPGENDVSRRARQRTIGVEFDRTGKLLAATNGYSTLIWSLETGNRIAELNRNKGYFSKVYFRDDGGLLVADDSARIRVLPRLNAAATWKGVTGARVAQYMAHSLDMRHVAVTGRGDSVYLWTVGDSLPGPVLRVPTSLHGPGMTFSPDGTMIATPGGWNGLYVWDSRTGTPIRSFHKFPGPVWRAWFTADGRSIVAYSLWDDQFRIVHLDAHSVDGVADSVTRAELSAVEQRWSAGSTARSPRTVAVTVKGPNDRAISGAEVLLVNGDSPDSVVRRGTTSSGGYASFSGITFPHIIFRARKPGFEPGVVYIHLARYDDGPYLIELKPVRDGPPS